MTPSDDVGDEVGRARLRPVLFDLWLPRGPELSWEVLGLRGIEALSQPYEFEVDLWSDDPDADFEQVLGADCELMLERNGLERRIYGVIAEVEILFAAQLRIARDGIGVRIKLVPAFRLLEHELDTRFFSGQTVIEILVELLGSRLGAYERTLDAESRIKGQYNRRDYCVQFRESTFAFCSRLMQEEGIAYMFVPDDETQRERMVLVDNNEDYATAELLVPEPIAIELDRPEELDRESLQVLHWRHKPSANRVLTRGYNYKLGTPFDEGVVEELDSSRPVVREQAHEGVQRQIIDDPQADPDATRFDGSGLAQQVPLARRLLESQRVGTAIGLGRGNVIGFTAGATFDLEQPIVGGPPTRRFLLTRVVHSGGVTETPESTNYAYENQFECIASNQVYRPPRTTPKPRVFGVQTGVVIGKVPDEIHTDSLGRVRVAFHLHHHSQDDEHSSCWIRVAQIWAGAGYGAIVIPRVGMEVVVTFVDGDPDCPLITGCVYNGRNQPPYELPAEMSKSTFKTSSTPGGDGFSEIRFEDAEGSEQVFVRAQRRMDLRVQGTLYATCTGNLEEVVGSPDSSAARYSTAHTQTVFGDINTLVRQDRMDRVLGAKHLTCTGDVHDGNQGNRMLHVQGLYQISALKLVSQAGEIISHRANQITLVGSDVLSLMGAGRVVLESNNAIELRVGNSFVSVDHGGIAISGHTLRLNSGGGVGHAEDALESEVFEVDWPLEAYAADDGRIRPKGSWRGSGRRSRERGKTIFEPHPVPPLKPPPLPKPDDPIVPFDISGVWKSMEWKEPEAWCSEPVSLRFEADHPSADEIETAFVRNAADGAVVTGVGVAARHGFFEQPVKLCDILPRTLPVGVEDSRELDAWLSNGLYSENSILFRFFSNSESVEHIDNSPHIHVRVHDHQVEIGGSIPYKRGMMAMIISLGKLAPELVGGLIWQKQKGSLDWRYCKRVNGGLVYWNGDAWRPVPAGFEEHKKKGDKIKGMAVWKDEGESEIQKQFGNTAWPDPYLPEWSPENMELMKEREVAWAKAINEAWTGKLDLKRDQCHGTDPRCCRYFVRCNIGFHEVTSKAQGGIVVGEDEARANAEAWHLKISDRTAYHEFGHLLGNRDEYAKAWRKNIWRNDDGAVLGVDEDSIMGSGSIVRRRHLSSVANALARLVERETRRVAGLAGVATGKSYTYTPVEVWK